MEGLGAQEIQGKITDTLMSPAQMFLWGEGDLPVDPLDKTLSGLPAEPGFPIWLGVAVAWYVIANRKGTTESRRKIGWLTFYGILGIMASTTFSPGEEFRPLCMEFRIMSNLHGVL